MNNKTKFDEFLDSYYAVYNTPDFDFLRTPYNEKLDTIFKTHFGHLDYSNKLEGVAIYDKENHKLYGASYMFDPDIPMTFENRDVTSSYYVESIDKLKEEMNLKIIEKLDDYTVENIENLLNLGYEENHNPEIMEEKIEDIHKDLESITKTKFVRSEDIVTYKNKMKNDLIKDYGYAFYPEDVYNYLDDDKVFTKNYFDKLMNSERYDVPFVNRWARQVYCNTYMSLYLDEITDNKDNQFDDLYKAREILNTIKDKDYQTVNITINKDNQEMCFKYSTKYFRVYNDLSLTHYGIVDAKERKAYEQTFGDNLQNDFSLNDIKKMTYGRNVIYEDSTMDKPKEIVSPKMEEDVLIEREESLVYDKEDFDMEI